MTQSAMCIPLWPARNGNTAYLVMCPFAGGSSSAFRHWQAEQLADCALSLAPQGLIISGCHAPHLHSERQLSHRDDADFIAELIDIGGCSPELRENQELMSLFLPLLRADFYATESYHYDSPDVCPPLRTPALLLCGSHDREASWQQVDAWRQWLSHVTGPVVIDGDHFYPIQQARSFFTQIVRHFPHAFSAMTAWQKQPSTSER